MIGQNNVLKYIDNLIETKFPRFLVITGEKGQGKKLLARKIAEKLNYPIVISGIKIDEIRDIINLAYKQTEPIIYLIPDADKMSLGAKNSLLKVIEEPPNNAYFIMTLSQLNNTLETIKSRCQHIMMENYSEEDLIKMLSNINSNLSEVDKYIAYDICENYYQLQLLNRYGINEFYKFVKKVTDNIYKVQSANSFKLTERLDVKDDGNGYDLNLFFQTFKIICLNNLYQGCDSLDQSDIEIFNNYYKSIEVTSNYQNKLNINGISKQSLLDCWILNIRKIWRD